MDSKISVERLFSLGDFKNIKFYDEIASIPQEIIGNPEAMRLLRYLQLVDIEYSYSRYQELANKLYGQKLPLEQILETLENERVTVFSELAKVINTVKE